MRPTFFVFCTFCFVLMCNISCNKLSPAEEYPFSFLDQNLKDYYNYNDGSYWIYKDSLTGDIDSFVIIKLYNNKQVLYHDKDRNVELTAIRVHQYSVNRVPTDSAVWDWELERTAAWLYYGLTQTRISYTFGSIPNTLGDYVRYYKGPPCIDDTSYYGVRHLPIYMVDTTVYSDVFEKYFRCTTLKCDDIIPQDDKFYINKEQGLVKIVLNNYVHRVWELQRYHINR